MRKIKQAEENEKKQEAKDNMSRLEVSFFQEPYKTTFIEPVILEATSNTFAGFNYHYSSRYLSNIIRPPKQAA